MPSSADKEAVSSELEGGLGGGVTVALDVIVNPDVFKKKLRVSMGPKIREQHVSKIYDAYVNTPWCVLTRFSPVSCFADLQEQNVFKIDFEHKFEQFRTLAFHWYQFYQDLNKFY